MNGERGTTRPPVWRDDRARSVPRIRHEVFRGAEGLRELTLGARLDSRDPAGFGGEVSSAELGDLELRRVALTPHRAIVDGHDRGTHSDVLRFLSVQHGHLLLAPPGGRPVRIEARDAIFTCRPRTYVYQADEPVVVVAATLPIASLPFVVRRMEDLPVGPLPHSPLVDAFVDLLLTLTARLDERWTFDADYAARGLIDLEAAILADIIAPQVPVPGPDRVYSAAVDYMERHLSDPELRPPQIAEAIGVSVRYLHRAFDDTGTTVARYLRERRLELVAAALRSTERSPNLQLLATRYGFGSQDQLARAFRRRFGASMTAYRRSGAR